MGIERSKIGPSQRQDKNGRIKSISGRIVPGKKLWVQNECGNKGKYIYRRIKIYYIPKLDI